MRRPCRVSRRSLLRNAWNKRRKVGLGEFLAFWRPQWDALGKSHASKRVFLVEAKAHIPELISTLQATNPNSKSKIRASLEKTKADLGCKADFDWSTTFYQYANRLAHVNFLKQNIIPAYLISVYFLNDTEMGGPKTSEEWKGAIKLLHQCLGLKERTLKKFAADIFIDTCALK